jgi:hypothetical protein
MSKVIDLTGKIYGRLKVIALHRSKIKGPTTWFCKCSCGNGLNVLSANIIKGKTTSCGCARKELTSVRSRTYNKNNSESKTKEYITWTNLRARCYNVKKIEYYRYGGRGIVALTE